jgi:hypothetical protein
MATIPTIEANPCGRLKALREVRDQVMTGGAVTEAEFEQGNGTRRRVKYTAANMDMLNREIIAAGDACAAKTTGVVRPKRFAIGGRMS